MLCAFPRRAEQQKERVLQCEFFEFLQVSGLGWKGTINVLLLLLFCLDPMAVAVAVVVAVAVAVAVVG